MMSTGAKPRWHPSDAVSVDAGAMCGRQRHQRRFGRTPLSSGLPPTADMRTSAGFRRCGPLSRHRRAEIPQCASSPAAHSRLILAAKITVLHFFTSSEISLAKSSGDPARVVPPRLASCAWSFGTAILTLTSLFSFSMTSAGVRFGPQMPYHELASYPGKVSPRAGTSGNIGERASVVTARARRLPALTYSSDQSSGPK